MKTCRRDPASEHGAYRVGGDKLTSQDNPERRGKSCSLCSRKDAILAALLKERHMPREIVFTADAAKPPATYSQAVKAAGLVFVSGTGPHDPATGQIKGTTIQEQTRRCLENIRAILLAAGSSLDKIVSATVILAEEDDFAGMNEEWVKWFPADPPSRQGAKLPVKVPGLKVSIAVIAEC
jgi:2-iminobutanoate/2-iminopropanoate deaminase